MNIRRSVVLAAAGAAVAGGLGIAPSATAMQATPATSHSTRETSTKHVKADCVFWHDSRTQGVACGGGPYQAWAKCDNGKYVFGKAVSNYSWSYAYCSSVGAYRRTGDVNFL
ncbi:hypothetical protein HEK616_33810 [Streptomyces nigrescens]|uniref:Secreted protein n=2 Tax=Streptomyces TaxID=1883 RepID=A0ABM7ZU26_STRNI|nr:hypothetical protein [Streptomyces nigrescens]MEE4417786.1 hypothetical protein [Streptomyces sp. DSM 41528]BDM69894.1 hypothetical protein HEK616_33810 [Streptomyces nigrescens]